MASDKLVELRKKSVDAKAKKHSELLESSASIREAIEALHSSIDKQQPYDDSRVVQYLQELKEAQTFTKDVERLESALKAISNEDKLDELIKTVGRWRSADVVEAVNALMEKLEVKSLDQSPSEFQPVRRVIKVGDRFIFDDTPTPIAMGGGGGGKSASVQASLIEDNRVKVISPLLTERFDYGTSPFYYVGSAPLGSATSQPVWTIEFFDLTDSSNATGMKAKNAVWDNRLTEVYS